MKNTQAIILAALLAATAAQAAEPATSPFYLTAAAGPTHLNVDCAGTVSCDTRGNGGKLMAGYSFGNGFSLEGGYIGFGKARAADSAVSATLKPTALVLGGAYSLPLGSDWGLVVRLGIGQVKTRADFVAGAGTQRGSASERETKVVAGIGARYAVSSNVKLELGVDATEAQFAGEKGNVRLISLGATFAF